jgi:hypothetical protein
MLQKLKDLRGDRIAASDGDIGTLEALYFDDREWRVRYLVVDTGGWLSGRKVLIPPLAIHREKSTKRALAVALSRAEVERSPGIDADKPVSRKYEEAYARLYGVPLYWTASDEGSLRTDERSFERGRRLEDAKQEAASSHLRSSSQVTGYAVRASDGRIGHVDDMRVNDGDWVIVDLVIDTGDWLPGRRVPVPTSAVQAIDWHAKEVRLSITRAEVERAGLAA